MRSSLHGSTSVDLGTHRSPHVPSMTLKGSWRTRRLEAGMGWWVWSLSCPGLPGKDFLLRSKVF